MWQFVRHKFEILRRPLTGLNLSQRWFIKSFLLCFSHLVNVKGYDNTVMHAPGPQIFAFNHNCSFETVLVPCYLIHCRQGRKISFIADWMYQHIPIIGWIIKQMDPVYVYNKPARFKFLNRFRVTSRREPVYRKCIQRLEQGASLGIFPEGTRNRNPKELLKGQKGIGYIALHSAVPVVPVGIDFPARYKYGRIPKLGSLILRIGPPLTFQEEIAEFCKINSISSLDIRERQKLSDYLASKITYRIMKELAILSGKNYPFQEPAPPSFLKRFFIASNQ